MQTTILGRTGLKVGVAGLGCGGASRLGRSAGLTAEQSADIVRAALDRGVNVIDTAQLYGTETIVGSALRGRREGVVLSSKTRPNRPGTHWDSVDLIDSAELVASVERSLKTLQTERIDIFYMHGVRPHQYERMRDAHLPTLRKLQRDGKIGFAGVTESFGVDLERETLTRAIADGFDVVMAGFNLLNPSATKTVLPRARAQGVGVYCMYAVRGALAREVEFRNAVGRMIAKGELDADVDADALLSLLLNPQTAGTLHEAAYRYCRHTPGVDVVLFGTGSKTHLRENIRAIEGPPLPADVVAALAAVFGKASRETGDLPR